MRILVSWLREFIDVPDTPEALGRTLTMRGFELGAVERATVGGTADVVLDFEITANRPDALSVIGFARECRTVYSLPMQEPVLAPLAGTATADLTVSLDAPDLCPRYAAAVAEVTIGPSPAWLADRLAAAGIRPINNVVDVTNYVLIELGQPMHAFDLARLAGRHIRVRRASAGERMTTLDGVERALDPKMLVIADAERAQAIAGVMGGGLSEVSAATRTIVLESACFAPASVRAASKALGLKSEASARFERGTDVAAPVAGLQRALALLEQIGAGRARGGVIDCYPAPMPATVVTLRLERVNRILGCDVPAADVDRILSGLGFAVAAAGDGRYIVTVPSFRVDVSREIDLIEEVARHHGYERLPATFPPLTSPAPPSDPRIDRDRLVRRVLRGAGCSEALSFSFIEARLAEPFAPAASIVAISNPLSAQFAVLRPSLLPGLLTSLAHNRHRERTDVRLFEVGAVMTRQGESRHVAVAWTGNAGGAHWSGGSRTVDFFDAKGLAEIVGRALGTELTFTAAAAPSHLVAGRAAIIRCGEMSIGSVGLLMSSIAESAGVPPHDEVYVCELDLDALSDRSAAGPITIRPLPRYPSIARDISIVIDDTLPAAAVRGTIRAVAPETLESVREFDRYQGKGVPDGRVSLSLRLTFRSPERTLTDADVQTAMDGIMAALVRAHQAVQR